MDITLIFSQHITNLTHSSFLSTDTPLSSPEIIPIPIFTYIVHAFLCFRIDYCNSLTVGLPKIRISSLQYVLNAAVRLIVRLPRLPHVSINQHLHWLPIFLLI